MKILLYFNPKLIKATVKLIISFIFFLSNFIEISSKVNGQKLPLPINGDIDEEIKLNLNLPEGISKLFKLNGKFLQLVHPLDRDKENLSHIQFTVSFESHH